jgi:hypothetical protein
MNTKTTLDVWRVQNEGDKMNYHFNLRKRGWTFWTVERIAQRLALRTGRARLAWSTVKGRAHIIVEGPEGFQRAPTVNPDPNDVGYRLAGQTPPHDSVDWQNGALVECTPVFEGHHENY